MWKTKPMSMESSVHSSAPVAEAAVVSIATKVGMGGGSAASAVGWLASNNTVVVTGLFVTILGFLINLYYQRRRDNRETRESELKMALDQAEEKRNEELHKAQMSVLHRRSTDGK